MHFVFGFLPSEPFPATEIELNPATSTAEPLSFTIDAQDSATFGIFVAGRDEIAPDPLKNRIFVRFEDAQGQTIGSTSVAVLTGYS